MARTFELTDGSDTISLINTGATGIIAKRGGFGGYQIKDLVKPGQVAETYSLVLKGSSHDNAASQMQSFVDLLVKAKLFHDDEGAQDAPVYLKQQTTNETNARHAMVYTAAELEIPDLFDQPFEGDSDIENFSLTIIRGHPWESGAPGSLGSAITLGASDGASDPTMVHVANFRDDVDVTHVKTSDGGVFDDVGLSDNLLPPTPAQNDYVYFGSTDQPVKHVVIPKLSTAGNLTTTTLTLEYYNGSWTALVAGDDYTIFPGADLEASLEQNDYDIVINVKPPSDWTTVSIDSVSAYWIRIVEGNAAPSYAQVPQTNASDSIYAQSHPYVEIPAAQMDGDSPPLFNIRIWSPAGGDADEAFSVISRILMGIKSGTLSKFTPWLNAGGDDNPADWTTNQGTDATSTADPEAPAGKHSAVDFSGDSTMVNRVEFVGDDILDEWEGAYKAFIVCQQVGGSAGDLSVMLRTFIGSTDTYAPQKDSVEVKLAGVDEGPEAVDMGLLRIPFSRKYSADSLSATDLIQQIHAERSTGSSTLKIYGLFLLPVREGSVGPDHNAEGDTGGSGGLRGACVLDVDAGIIDWRAQKYIKVGSNLIPVENWAVMNDMLAFKKLGTKHRIYFLLLHYPTTFGTGPLICSFGMHVAVEIFAHYRYAVLRGAG